jgi:hypothetical protein
MTEGKRLANRHNLFPKVAVYHSLEFQLKDHWGYTIWMKVLMVYQKWVLLVYMGSSTLMGWSRMSVTLGMVIVQTFSNYIKALDELIIASKFRG